MLKEIGTKVIIKDFLVEDEWYPMEEYVADKNIIERLSKSYIKSTGNNILYKGQEATIVGYNEDKTAYLLNIDNGKNLWTSTMFVDDKILYLGSKVKIKPKKDIERFGDLINCRYCGREATIVGYWYEEMFQLDIDNKYHTWMSCMFEGYPNFNADIKVVQIP